eukprot:gene23140-27747_t
MEPDAPDLGAAENAATRRAERMRLYVQPVIVLILVAGVLIWAFSRDLNATQKASINLDNIVTLTWQHVLITAAVVIIVVAIAVPLGTLLTRPKFTRLAPFFVGIANIGAAAPAIGLLVLFYLATRTTGFWIGVFPIAFYSLLPVLRNTILGYQQVDKTLIDAGRGQGMSSLTVLRQLEFPMAVPYILAGLRTSLVLAVGTATLCFLVSAGGLGILIDTGYKLRDNVTLVVGAVLAVSLALLIDWLGALAETYLGPKGLTWGWKLAVATIGLTLVASCGLESGGALPLAVGPGSIEPVPELEGVKMTVGSKDFTEQIVLGYVIEFAMAAAGADVRDLTNIQGSNSTRDAQLNGQIDLAYEYTGTGWINYLGNETPLPDSQAQFEAVRDADLAANDMVWTDPAPMNNTYALAMSKETAEKTGVKTVSDYAKLVESDPGAAVTCVETEFNVRQDGYPGLAAKYGFDASRAQRQILQTGIIYQATADGDQCKFGEVFTTDGRIIALDLVLLDDDLQFFPKYNPALVMKKDFAEAHPQVAEVMAPISERLTNEVMTELNRQVDVDGKEPADVARDWLVSEGFVTAQ